MRPVLRKSSFLANLARARVLQTTSLSAMPPCTAEISRAQAMHSSARLDASAAFTAASERVSKLPAAPPNDVKLQLYALFKQATQGRNTTPKPGMFDMVAKAKWQAWSELGDLSSADAEQRYIQLVDSLAGSGTSSVSGAGSQARAAAAPASNASTATSTSTLAITTQGSVRTIAFNRPDKRNAISLDMYRELIAALKAADADAAVVVTVITGNGPFYSSGNDLNNFASAAGNLQKFAEEGRAILYEFVDQFITHSKVLVAGVNGPAVGLPVTTLPLFDFVFASSKATLHAPLVALGQAPEGCSSFTFPRIMGTARASDLLLRGRKITAAEGAGAYGLVTEVFEDSDFKAQLASRVGDLARLPPLALLASKRLLRVQEREQLRAVNQEECDVIKRCWLGNECQEAVMKFVTAKK